MGPRANHFLRLACLSSWGGLLADTVEVVVTAHLAQKFELLPQVFDQTGEALMGAKVFLEVISFRV